MNKKIILFTLILAGLFLAMAVISKIISLPQMKLFGPKPEVSDDGKYLSRAKGEAESIKSSLPVKAETRSETRPAEKEPVALEQEPRLPSGPLPN